MTAPQRNEPIAIVGSACRFAGDVNAPSKLWELLREPYDLRQEIPSSRFSAKGFYHPNASYHGHSNVSHAYFVNEDLSTFDAEFFGIKPTEAKAMDPQQRFLLEIAYEGLESAGMTIAHLRGSDTGVYVGVMFDDYGTMLLRDLQAAPTYYATGTGRSILANRISYCFDWHGPSITVDTACSSSLVAVHMAVQALRAGDCRVALACGTNLILGPENFIIESKLQMLSPDGRGRMWDQRANGYARGDGVAAIVLKSLSAALEDGDQIECIIRETGLNQDGATAAGITVPSASAQEALIRRTYARAGLDLLTPSGRPQYFEAHGTGTPVGDPTEAEAVYNAIANVGSDLNSDHPLYVGSNKTVFGHTEGAAGVAALLKTSLALQHGCIPPNLHFEQLSDRVAPFYKNVEIPRVAKPWPDVEGCTRRASVNSFGFGGANAHAILEQYCPNPNPKNHIQGSLSTPVDTVVVPFSPYVFSAFSEISLRANLSAYVAFLEDTRRGINPRDLAWTLLQHRSIFPYRVSLTAWSLDDLRSKIVAKLEEESTSIGVKALPEAKILGVFTGQGAQYARMGAELIETSETARSIIQELELHLAEIPEGGGPTWSLKAEILADADASRVHEAAISQPLCTAIQILLIDLLRLAGVYFDAVVGHSSGEIAAAYAAGYLTARDAMCIAYYRGVHVQLASSPNGPDIKGAMMAVGSSMEDVAELCTDKLFLGRIAVAASNSPSSVTVSGDEEAITELESVLDDEQIFHQRLKVDKAYHSNHMLPCIDPYMESLRRCVIKPQKSGRILCTWFSSVYNRPVDSDMIEQLSDLYWAENMIRPVFFSQAVSRAMAANPCDLAVEVGAHPSLKKPTSQTIQHILEMEIPYHGLLTRDTNAVEATSACLGFLWSCLDNTRVNLNGYERAMTGDGYTFSLVKGLPTYQWNHERKYWHESRSSRKMRLRSQKVHPLLGDISTDSTPHHMHWRNLLRVSEMEWLSGHQVQGQVVFPAAGYMVTALEASRILSESAGREICLFELRDFTIHHAVIFDQDNAGVEVFISLVDITRDVQQHSNRLQAKFTYSATLESHHTEDLTLAASGYVEILFGEPHPSLLPARKPALSHMIDVEPERFYAALADLGYDFSDRFRSLSALRRKHCQATCLVQMRPPEDGDESLLIHPTELDAALQSVILAHSYPYDEQLRTLHLPTSIRHIRVNPALCGAANRSEDEFVPVDASVMPRATGQRGVVGHVDLYLKSCQHAAIQVQEASFMPIDGAATEEGRRVYSKVHWVLSQPDGFEAACNIVLDSRHNDMVSLLERISTFYLRKFEREVPSDDPKRSEFPTNWYLNYAQHITSMVESGKHRWAKREWLNDSLDDIVEASKPFSGIPDVQIMQIVGTQMPRVFRGETTILEQFRADGNDILNKYYADGFGLKESAQWVSRTVNQIVDRYPHLNILEIGAGTGSATKAITREIGKNFLSYTYTDISAAFFENASSVFSQYRDRMKFKTLDVEKNPMEQGFLEGAYDLVVAFFVIHATSDLERCMRNIRKLLKPGGFLVVGEGQEGQNGVASSGFIFGTLPGWWLGAESGRILSPHISPMEWDKLLRSTGFSGVDSTPPKSFENVLNVFHFVSQAVDDQVNFFREPLALSSWSVPPIKELIIVGGQTARSSHLVEGLATILGGGRFAAETHSYKTIADVDYEIISADSLVISLTELDWPFFKGITQRLFEALKKMLGAGKTLLWVTSGRRDDEPFSNMMVGFGRTAMHETPDLRLQQLDIADPQSTNPQSIAEIAIRFHAAIHKNDNMLWTVEPEIVIDDMQRQLISRLRPIPELNDRYNSAYRRIIEDVDFRNSPISLQTDSNGCVIQRLSRYETSALGHHSTEDLIELHTTHTVLSAIKTPFGHKFLALGVQSETGTPYLTLVSSLTSLLNVPANSVISCYLIPDISNAEFLTMVAAHLVAMAILHPLLGGQTLVVHNPTRIVAQALATQAAAKDVCVVYTTDSIDESIPNSWIKLPRYLSQSDVSEMLLLDQPSSYVGFSNDDFQGSENEATMISTFQGHCQTFMTAKTIYSSTGSNSNPSAAAQIGDMVRRCLEYVQEDMCAKRHRPLLFKEPSVPLDSLARGLHPQDPLTIIDWTVATSLPVHVTRLDTNLVFRSTGSTYWIVGMSGALGISLSDWMISKGAKNLVLTSRNPNVAPEWIASHGRKGATVVVIPCDVTDETSLKAVHQKICDTLPPIAGVMNGAMVLRDTTIRNMTFDQLTDVVRPKVDGSIYLDQIFWDVDLDFFVLISSINCVIGNQGQANYAAANTFMCSLAAQRRNRGLRAAAVNAGAIVGAGYMERESRRALDQIVQRLYMMRLSEEDWCQAICEAIDASRLDSPHGPELTTGLSDVPFDIPNAPNWYSDPKFSSFIVHQQVNVINKNEGKATSSIQVLLQACQSQQDLQQIIKQAFAAQLRNVLQVTMSDDSLMSSRSGEIGLDSLVSVDIRSWFLKNLQVNIPVLKIMGNDTMANLTQFAVENVPMELLPQLYINEVANGLKVTAIGESTSNSSSEPPPDSEPLRGQNSSSSTAPNHGLHLANGYKQEATTNGNSIIDWEAESHPPANMADTLPALDQSAATIPPRVIVLTGVSGLLGHHLLNYLLTHTAVQKVICLAVRQLPSRLQSNKLPRDPRVIYYEGDLSHPFLGLTSDEATSIFTEVDAVIHNGADTSHLKYYMDLRAANVGSTITLARLCLPRGIPIHYVSSAGLAMMYHKTDAFPAVSVTGPGCLLPPDDGSFGYMCSKWTNERFLERVHDLYGLKICIHRPSTIIREGADATSSRAELDWVNALLHYARRMRAVPKIEHNRGALDLVYVGNACADIIRHVFHTNEGPKKVTYVHEVGDIVLPMYCLQDIGLEEEERKTFNVLPMHEWLAKATAVGLHPAVAALIETMDTAGGPNYPRLLKTTTIT